MVLNFLAAVCLSTLMPVEMRTGGDVSMYYAKTDPVPTGFTWTATDTRNGEVLKTVQLTFQHVHDTYMVYTAPVFTTDNWQYIHTDLHIENADLYGQVERQLFPLYNILGRNNHVNILNVQQLEFDTTVSPDTSSGERVGSVYLVMHGTADIENWVPEPSTFVLILLGVLAACTRLKN